jgi:hypothetical protein
MANASLVPAAPVDSVISDTVDRNVNIVMLTLAGLALAYSLVSWRRTGRPTFLLLFLAGGAMMVMEPIVDVVGGCWFPSNSWRAFELWGRPMPVWLCVTYFVYFGIGGGAIWTLMRRGAPARTLWLVWVGAVLADFALEATLMHWDTYLYYGDQPLVIAKFPFWWGAVNATIAVVVPGLIVLAERLPGWRDVYIVPLALSTSAAINIVVGWPSWTAVNSGPSDVVRELLGVASFAIAIAGLRLLLGVVAAKEPARREESLLAPALAR